jgi:hypothetical protein
MMSLPIRPNSSAGVIVKNKFVDHSMYLEVSGKCAYKGKCILGRHIRRLSFNNEWVQYTG